MKIRRLLALAILATMLALTAPQARRTLKARG